MPSGKKRHLASVMFLKSSTSLDSYGRVIDVSTQLASIKGSLVKLNGTERTAVEQAFGASSHRFECWYIPGITNKMWLVINGRKYNIIDIDNVEEKDFELSILLNSESS